MTPTGRNDPCACGSGRKHKRCCGARERVAQPPSAGRAGPTGATSRDEGWAVEAIPLPMAIDQPGSERPVAVLVVSGEKVLHQQLLGRLSGDASVVAATLADEVMTARRKERARPARIRVRHPDVRDALAPRLGPQGMEVQLRDSLPDLEACALGLMEFLGGHPSWPPMGRSDTWLGWDLEESLVAELFEAAASFWEAEPWRVMENMQAPRCRLPSGREWTAMVLGNGGMEFGLLLHSEAADAFERPGLEDPELGFAGIRGRIISLVFEPLSDMTRRARKEVASRRWRVAHTAACPDLMTINTPGGGIAEEDARDLCLVLRAIPRFAERHSDDLVGEMDSGRASLIRWTDAESGISFHYSGEAVRDAGLSEPGSGLPDDLRAELRQMLEEVGRTLEAEAGGEPLDPDELRARLNERLGTRIDLLNAAPLEEFGGLSPAQVQGLLSSDWGRGTGVLRLAADLSSTELAGVHAYEGMEALLTLAEEGGGLGRTQAGNLKVAAVEGWIDRLRPNLEDADDLLDHVRARSREADVPLLHWLRVLAEMAGWLEPRGGRFVLTPDGRRILASGREGERFALLFETCFRRFNLGYRLSFDWPEGQHQVAFTLYRLGEIGREWQTAGELLQRATVVPTALEALPPGKVERGAWVFETHLLWPLERFGLVESRRESEISAPLYRLTTRWDRLLRFVW